ncbi:MAG TPA: hypothetical protein VF070_23340 [Streptosporangiaceae bacterium]
MEAEPCRESDGDLLFDLRAVVLGVPEQGGLGRDESAGGEEALIPAGGQPGGRGGEGAVKSGEDGSGHLAV